MKVLAYLILVNMSLNMLCADPRDEFLYKIVKLEQWKESEKKGEIVLDENDKDFVHFSTEDQWRRIATKYYSKGPGYRLLKLKKSDIEPLGNLVFETNPGGIEKYYHLKPKDNKPITISVKLITENNEYLN